MKRSLVVALFGLLAVGCRGVEDNPLETSSFASVSVDTSKWPRLSVGYAYSNNPYTAALALESWIDFAPNEIQARALKKMSSLAEQEKIDENEIFFSLARKESGDIRPEEETVCAVALVGHGLHGFNFDDPSMSVLSFLFVDPQHQQTGCGTAMIALLAKSSLVNETTTLSVYSPDRNAVPFYEKLGFVGNRLTNLRAFYDDWIAKQNRECGF